MFLCFSELPLGVPYIFLHIPLWQTLHPACCCLGGRDFEPPSLKSFGPSVLGIQARAIGWNSERWGRGCTRIGECKLRVCPKECSLIPLILLFLSGISSRSLTPPSPVTITDVGTMVGRAESIGCLSCRFLTASGWPHISRRRWCQLTMPHGSSGPTFLQLQQI